MSDNPFTLADLKRILFEGSGAPDDVDPEADIFDTEFESLGYDSLAIMETASRVEREYGIPVGSIALDATTPRAFFDAVNGRGNAL